MGNAVTGFSKAAAYAGRTEWKDDCGNAYSAEYTVYRNYDIIKIYRRVDEKSGVKILETSSQFLKPVADVLLKEIERIRKEELSD